MDRNFTKEVLKKVKNLEITTKKLVNDALAGHYHSVFKGQGMNFSEIREYNVGDDVKNIDWNVTARQGTPHIKKYNEERERTILLLVDISSSTLFGSHESKKSIIAELSSVIAFSADKNRDKVGLLLFSDRVELFIPPGKGRSHLLRIIRELLFFKPTGEKTDIIKVLDYINRTFSRKVITFLISDFALNTIPNDLSIKLKSTGKHHDLITVRVKDKNEEEIPNIGILTLKDLESGEVLEVNTSSKHTRKKYRELIKKRDERISEVIKKSGLDLLEVNTKDDYMPILLKFFTIREKRVS